MLADLRDEISSRPLAVDHPYNEGLGMGATSFFEDFFRLFAVGGVPDGVFIHPVIEIFFDIG